ncbi:MAG: NADH-quinone oxidoreductase subunit NuoK [Pseudomonadota bacterium]
MMGLEHSLAFSAVLFVIGLGGLILNRQNVFVQFIALQIMMLAGFMNLLAFSTALNDLAGLVFALLVLVISAAQAAVGICVIALFRQDHDQRDTKTAGVGTG